MYFVKMYLSFAFLVNDDWWLIWAAAPNLKGEKKKSNNLN